MAGLHPSAVLQALKEQYPGKFDDLAPGALLDALKELSPETYKLVDPMLIGAELLTPHPATPRPPTTLGPRATRTVNGRVTSVAGQPADPTQPLPLPTVPTPHGGADTALGTAIALAPTFAGTAIGTVRGGRPGGMVGGAAGAAVGEWGRQQLEEYLGQREETSWPVIGTEAALGAFNPAATASTVPRRIAQQAALGAGMNVASTTARAGFEEHRAPTFEEALQAAGMGAIVGGALHTGVEGYGALRGAAPSFGDATGALPTDPGLDRRVVPSNLPPPPGWNVDPVAWQAAVDLYNAGPPLHPAIQAASAAQYQAEETRLTEKLRSTFGDRAVTQVGGAHQALEAKSYLDELSALKVSNDQLTTTMEAMANTLDPQVPPPAPPPPARPKLLPEWAGASSGGPEGPILAFPPGENPPIELVGAGAPPASRIVGGRDVGTLPPPPPTLQDIVARIATGESNPGAPQLVLAGEPVSSGIPRGTGELIEPPARPFDRPLEPSPRMGGRPATPDQPRLPRVEEPGYDRPYTTGPNAGPRRKGELHGQPRSTRRQVRTGKVVSYETAPTALKAEDPGTYPPEVRREMARMAQELEDFPHERVYGGLTRGQMDALTDEMGSVAAGIGEAKRRGATSGGAIPGAPVYHEILDAAQGARAHATRAEMLQDLRAALLEGKGSPLSDAAAQVARGRLEQEASGVPRRRGFLPKHQIRNPVGAGDALIGWVDEAGNRALPRQDLTEAQHAARDASDGEIWAAYKHLQEDPEAIPEGARDFFEAASDEAYRRGLARPVQEPLTMEGPGGAGGPKITDFDGAPPEQPVLPGAETVRTQEIPTPEVAEAPFALTPPPERPSTAAEVKRMTARRQGSLFDRLSGEEGVLVFKVPAGDRKGLRKWLKDQEKLHGGEAWYSRVEAAVEAGEWDRAFKAAAAASARSYAAASAAARTPAEERQLSRAVRGTPLQDDLNTQIIAQARKDAGVGTAPPVKDFPPSPRVTQAGAARGRATIGPAGILNPGPPQRPLSSLAPELRAGTLDNEVVKLLLEASDPEMMALVPGNRDTALRLFRQVGETTYRGQNLKFLREAGVTIAPEDLAQHVNNTVSSWGRGLQSLQAFGQANKEILEEAAEAMSMGGMLRGMKGTLSGGSPVIRGARNRPIGRAGAMPPEQTLDVLSELNTDTVNFERAMFANTLQKRQEVSGLRAVHDASYAFMLSKWNTAVRNYASFVGRYGIESLDHALTIPTAQLLGDRPTATLSKELLRGRARGMFGAKGTKAVRPWSDTVQDIFDITTETLNRMRPQDARRALTLLSHFPERSAEFLGTMMGEDLSESFRNTPVLRHLTNPRVQRWLTTFNRAQEFTGRAQVFDGTMRALLRAKGLDDLTLLQKPLDQIEAAVGGKIALDDLLYTATSQALEATFAGRVSKDSIPGALIRMLNTMWGAKLGFPFPKFNFSAAPRFIWDHSLMALIDGVRYPLDAMGITAAPGSAAGGRLYRGVRAQKIEQQAMPELALKIGQAERRQGEALGELLATQREWSIRNRQITRLQKRAQDGLPGVQTTLDQAIEAQSQLGRRREDLKTQMAAARFTVKDLKAQQSKLLDVLNDARGINAPNFSQYLARIGTGTVGLLGAAWVVRSQEAAQGTRWYEYRVDREGKDPVVLDFRPFAPFAQYLFVADVLHDFYQHTNWEGYKAQVGEGQSGPLTARALWDNYEGKYTSGELSTQFLQAFASISRAAGTTLTLTDLLTRQGVPGPQDILDSVVGTIGQFLSRFTVPGGMARDVIGQFDPEEAKSRIPPRATLEDWERPLGAPLGNIPYASQVIPETVSQTTGQPIAAEYPLLRGLAGIGTTPRDFVTEEVRRVGVPGQSVFIRETGDVGLDRLVAETYAQVLQESLPEILEDEVYTSLGTPARQRDFLQRRVFPPLKRATLAIVRESLGEDRFLGATVRGEEARRRQRQQRLLEDLEPETVEVPVDPDGPPPAPPGP